MYLLSRGETDNEVCTEDANLSAKIQQLLNVYWN